MLRFAQLCKIERRKSGGPGQSVTSQVCGAGLNLNIYKAQLRKVPGGVAQELTEKGRPTSD